MPRLNGTPRADILYAPDDGAIVHGRGSGDMIYGGAGFDRLYGDNGDDYITAYDSMDQLYGGRGNDNLSGGAERRGGDGDDWLSGDGLHVGGSGDDHIGGRGQMFGDEGPGREQRVAGNDQMEHSPDFAIADYTTMTGGLGSDQFLAVGRVRDGALQRVEIMDFTPGADKVGLIEWFDDGVESTDPLLTTFLRLDSTGDGRWAWDDSVGPDGDWTTLDGSAVYTDGHNMYIGLGATFAGPSSNDAQDWVVIHGTTQITLADWLTF